MNTRSLVVSILRAVTTVLAVALLARLTLFQVFSIPSQSMAPALEAGDQIIVTPYRHLRGSGPVRGDVIVFAQDDGEGGEFFVKRVVAVPGEHVEIRGGELIINGHALEEPYAARLSEDDLHAPEIIPTERFFVLGDNRPVSIDSRTWGLVDRHQIVGRARLIYWSSGTPADVPSAIAATGGSSDPPREIRWSRILKRIR